MNAYILKNWLCSIWFIYKSDLHISTAGNRIWLVNQTLLNLEQQQYLPYYWSDKFVQGTVVNWTLPYFHGESFWTTLTVYTVHCTLYTVQQLRLSKKKG